MRAAIMQPTYIPWAGYFDLMDQVDVFVLLDNVQFEKRSWQQRNRIKGPNGLQMLTVPVLSRARFDQRIMDVMLAEASFCHQHIASIAHAYSKARFLEPYFSSFSTILSDRVKNGLLAGVTIPILTWIAKSISIATPLRRASELKSSGKRTELLAAICEEIGATSYLSPAGANLYLAEERDAFDRRNIKILLQDYNPIPYAQMYPPFTPYASAIDILFNHGPAAIEIIRSGRKPPLTLEDWRTKSLAKAQSSTVQL